MIKVPRGVTHIEVTVSDLNRSLRFYRDLIGLKEAIVDTADHAEEGEDALSAEKMDAIHEIAGRKWRHAVLRYEGAPDGVFRSGYEQCAIVLLQPYDPPPSG